MATNKTEEVEVEAGQQLELIDVSPANMRKIKPVAQKYRAVQRRRIKALADEADLKQQLLDLVKEAGLQRLDDGTIRFMCDSVLITVTPRDELVRVRDQEEE